MIVSYICWCDSIDICLWMYPTKLSQWIYLTYIGGHIQLELISKVCFALISEHIQLSYTVEASVFGIGVCVW